MVPASTLQWLYGVLQAGYGGPVVTYQDVVLVMDTFADVRLRTDVYTHRDGRQELLLNMFTAPTPSERVLVPSKDQNAYKLVIHLPLDYPHTAPLAYVVPSVGFLVLAGEEVDADGLLRPPAWQTWRRLHGMDTTNDGVDPRDNRLLDFVLSVRTTLAKGVVLAPPALPQKPGHSAAVESGPNNAELLSRVQLELDMALYTRLTDITSRVLSSQQSLQDFQQTLAADLASIHDQSELLDSKAREVEIERERVAAVLANLTAKAETPVSELVPDPPALAPHANVRALEDLLKLLESMFLGNRLSLEQYMRAVRELGLKIAHYRAL